MNRILSYISLILSSLLLLLAFTACEDEKFYDDSYVGEGEATLSAEVLFKNFVPALDDNSRAVKGTALDGIDNLYLFVYSSNGQELLYNPIFKKGEGLNVTNDNYSTPSDGSYQPSGSVSLPTQQGSFEFKLPFGKYKIYAVANVRPSDAHLLSFDKMTTEDDLKKVSFTWNNTDVTDNGQMFGVFTTKELSQSPAEVFNAEPVTIGREAVKIRAWLRRLASKVTVAFDATDLRDNVRIYIKSLRIKDIPASCVVGMDNVPSANEQLITEGDFINYTREDRNSTDFNWSDKTAGLKLSRGVVTGSKDHANDDDNSLFFFENAQEDKTNDPNKSWYHKIQPADKVGTSINTPEPDPDHASGINDYKDRMPYGTYIEVEGYYKSDNVDQLGEGKIIYRFMLGKDVDYNYDAERNYHYKLTLKFNNWANDPDWHIVYSQPTPTVITPNIYYISYLYNQQMGFPVRVTTQDGGSATEYTLRAEIIGNNWGPTSDDPENNDTSHGDVPDHFVGAVSDPNAFAWNKPVFDGTGSYKNEYSAQDVEIFGKKIKVGANHVGFLTLRKNQKTVVGNGRAYADESTRQFLKDIYNGENNDEVTSPRWWAEYPLASIGQNNVCGSAADGQYIVTQHTDGSVTAKVPMFTRAKEIVPASDFTGNNPFEAYMRVAYVKFTLYKTNDPTKTPVEFRDIENPDTRVKERVVPIYQVRRINNPKAIWRKSGSTEPFHVKLMHRPDAASTGFSPVSSRGPWRAYILQDPNGIVTLSAGSQTVTGKMSMDENDEPTGKNMISGNTDDETIEFTYTPSGADGCAIIRVDYHDYTCHHLIYVRSGYDYGVKLGNAMWSCYNAYAVQAVGLVENADKVSVEVTKHPFSIGTFYKRNDYTHGILESNVKNFGWLANIGQLETISLESGARKTSTANWGGFSGYAWSMSGASVANRWQRAKNSWASTWEPTDDKIDELALPTYDDYYSLIDNNNSLSGNIEFGYGIAYTDGATEVATTLDNAYGFTDFDNDGNADAGAVVNGQTKGMRVCIVYNKTNGDQIVLPLGTEGQGRRPRRVNSGGSYDYNSGEAGSLSYTAAKGVLNSPLVNIYRPITYNNYRNAGAVYWIRKPELRKPNEDDGDWCTAWDINYNNVVFNHYDYGTLWSNHSVNGAWSSSSASDALPMRFIYKE
ncbi:MAG: hypothetical protein HDS49_03880 [Bacteroides sp.]|nr:hypothetical protein [Bacteroides sp.]